jgi:hypothetical protein
MDKYANDVLRAVLQNNGLDTSGIKETLVKRLQSQINEKKLKELDILKQLADAEVICANDQQI